MDTSYACASWFLLWNHHLVLDDRVSTVGTFKVYYVLKLIMNSIMIEEAIKLYVSSCIVFMTSGARFKLKSLLKTCSSTNDIYVSYNYVQLCWSWCYKLSSGACGIHHHEHQLFEPVEQIFNGKQLIFSLHGRSPILFLYSSNCNSDVYCS